MISKVHVREHAFAQIILYKHTILSQLHRGICSTQRYRNHGLRVKCRKQV